MSTFTQADLDEALSDYRASLSEAMEFSKAWHERLQGGTDPSSTQVSLFCERTDKLNAKVAAAWDHYSRVVAFYYHL